MFPLDLFFWMSCPCALGLILVNHFWGDSILFQGSPLVDSVSTCGSVESQTLTHIALDLFPGSSMQFRSLLDAVTKEGNTYITHRPTWYYIIFFAYHLKHRLVLCSVKIWNSLVCDTHKRRGGGYFLQHWKKVPKRKYQRVMLPAWLKTETTKCIPVTLLMYSISS